MVFTLTQEVIFRLKKFIRSIAKIILPRGLLTAKFWNSTNTAQDATYWWNFNAVREIMFEWVTGDPKTSWVTHQIKNRPNPFGRVLAFGDGFGMAAEAAATRGDTREVIYFNISPGECHRFQELFAAHEFTFPYQCRLGDANRFPFVSLGKFDTIISVGAFHHLFNFETIFPQLNQILSDSGLLYADEFIGPTKMSYDSFLIDQINQMLKTLPGELIFNRNPLTLEDFPNLWKRSQDQSECVRSSELDAWIKRSFDIIESRPFGGTLLMPLFLTSHLSPPRVLVNGWREGDLGQNELRKIARREKTLITQGKLPAHYMYYVGRKKPG